VGIELERCVVHYIPLPKERLKQKVQSKKVAAKPPFSGGIHFEFGFFIRPSNLRILFANVKREKKNYCDFYISI
jgi:hypothetical protein